MGQGTAPACFQGFYWFLSEQNPKFKRTGRFFFTQIPQISQMVDGVRQDARRIAGVARMGLPNRFLRHQRHQRGIFFTQIPQISQMFMPCGRMPGRSAALSGHINPEVSFASFVGLWDREPRQPVFKVFTGFCQNRTLNSSAQVDFFSRRFRRSRRWLMARGRMRGGLPAWAAWGYRTDFCVISVGFFSAQATNPVCFSF